LILNLKNTALGVLGCCALSAAAAATPAWVTASNHAAQILLDEQGKYAPESVSALGVERYDAEIFDLKPRTVERQEADLDTVATQYEQAIKGESDPQVRQDLEILLKAARDQRTTTELQDRLLLPYFDLPQGLFNGFQQLLDKRVAKSRYPAALIRLKRYAGTAPGYEPITKLARDRLEERLADPKLTFPWAVEVEEELKNQGQYLSGIRDLLQQSGLKGWQKDFGTLSAQVDAYCKWVRATVLPRARQTNLLPPEIYADNLKQIGVSMDPHELMDRALFAFQQIRDEMQSLALVIAQQHGWKSGDYRDVIRELKKQRIPNDKLLEVYRARLASIEQIIRAQHLITLPERAAAIRLATPAESAAIPAPHFSPPRLLGNTGEVGEFVLPTSNPNAESKAEMDDFNFDAITWTLTAHEARPGHELQFAAMIEHGVSIARAVFAFNSANVEGWGLYAESIVKPYLGPEAQFGVLQARLQRAARAFLDPMLNFGLMKPADAKRVLMEDVVLSEPLAKEEVDRYTFLSPGQATAYFFGYSKLEALRAKTQLLLGDKFDAQSYHDFIIAQGLLPPELLEKAVMEYYVKARLG
jgi:Bacterial protein of unknown function (DUF885)